MRGYWVVFWVVGFCVMASAGPLAAADAPASAYHSARRAYFALKKDSARQRYRHHWFNVIRRFEKISENFPEHSLAARALYTEAELWKGLYSVSRRREDLREALSSYELVELNHPGSRFADDALWQRAHIFESRLKRAPEAAYELLDLLRRYPQGDMAPRAREAVRKLGEVPPRAPPDRRSTQRAFRRGRPREQSGRSRVLKFRHWSNDSYSRVAVYLDGATEIDTGTVKPDPAGSLPARIFIDILNSSLAPDFEEPVKVNDRLLGRLRVAQRDDGGVRLALDLKDAAVDHRILVMENPFRVLIDAYGGTRELGESLETDLPRAVRRVVLDPGHGGHDAGAGGAGGHSEKEVVLQITKRVQAYLLREGVEVVLTRDADRFVSLEERTAIANRSGADAFVSIHANSHSDPDVSGIETYYLNVTDDQYSNRLAALENSTSPEPPTDVRLALSDLAVRVNTPESKRLATGIQTSLVALSTRGNRGIRDLGVKSALFYVLLGVQMPSALVETSFISNPREARLLSTVGYQAQLASAIAEGILDHFSSLGEE